MRPRTSRTRVAQAIGGALLLLGLTAVTALARGPAIFSIEIDLDTGAETFTAASPLLCESGDAYTDFERAAGSFGAAGSFHLTKLLVCDDGSGSFVIRVDVGANFVVGSGTTGGWSVVPGSGTGQYVGLKGGGSIVGTGVDAPPIDLVDDYFGSLRL